MKRIILLLFAVLALISLNPVFGQTYFWNVSDEFEYFPLPVGGWNTLGSFGPRSAAMGETMFSSSDGTSGFLNPAVLALVKRPQLSLNFRHSENEYKTTVGIRPNPYSDVEYLGKSFKRNIDYVDSINVAVPLGDWGFAASYFLFQEYDFPEINVFSDGFQDTVQQSGAMRGLNSALSFRPISSLSLGISASYVFGDINRRIPGYRHSNTYDLHMKGHYVSFGAAFEPGGKWKIGLTLRPPFSIDVDSEMELDYSNPAWVPLKTSHLSFRQPLVVVGSVLYRPADSFELTADVSYWDWSHVTSDLTLSGYPFQNFLSAIKLNLGAEYRIRLPFPSNKDLYLRAGYIYDPQYFLYSEPSNFSRDYFCAGLGLSIGHLEMGFSAKLRLSPRELHRFHADVFQAGATYRF